MEYSLYLNDARCLHPHNECDYFVYGGFIMVSEDTMILSNRMRAIEKTIFKTQHEVKASSMKNSNQKSIIKGTIDYCYPVFIITKISVLNKVEFTDPRKVNRYKNFMLRNLIEQLFKEKLLYDCDLLNIYLDDQPIALCDRDSLEDYLYNIFVYESYYVNIENPYIKAIDTDFHVEYKDSKYNKLIQLADVYVNSKYRRFKNQEVGSSKKSVDKCLCVKLPYGAVYKSY